METAPDLTDSELWYEGAFESYPSVVAHEYRRLRELLAEGQVYGALLQTKDLFEVILKLPVLAYAAYLYRKDRERTEDKLLVDLLKEPLSLGTWESLGRRMLNQVELPAAAIEKHLADVLALFSKYGIVKWRNDVIGHGALSLNEAHDLERDIAALLRAAKSFLLSQDGFYRGVELRLESGGADGVLRGWKSARLQDGGSENEAASQDDVSAGKAAGKAAVSLRCGDFAVDLYPFVFLNGGDLFFFDSFLYRKEKSCVISYPPGFRRNESLPEVLELAKTVDLATAMASVEGGYGETTYLAENDAIIQSLFAVEDFRRPDHLVDWLSGALKKYPKGVFHLAMEMGMGKSTFSRALDPTRSSGDMAIALKNATVRGYYLNDSYLSSAEAFCNAANDIFNRDKDGAQLFQSSTAVLPRLQPGSGSPSRDLSDLLRFYRDAYERHYGTARLLFVVDGLEEIPAGQARTILDFLPQPDELADGVYILLTSRLAEELPPHFRGAEVLEKVTESLSVDRQRPEYRQILLDYVKRNILDETGSERSIEPSTLLEKAEWRFLYVRLYRDLLRSYGHERPQTLPGGGELLERYLERLRRLYGDKFRGRTTTLMAILASAYEPLTLQEIAYLSGREEVDFLMLAHLADLRAFFKTERSYRGNLVSLHAEWKAAAKRLLQPAIRELAAGWIEDCASMPQDSLDAENEGMTYLLSRLGEYGRDCGIPDTWRDKNIAELLWAMAVRVCGKTGALHDIGRELLMLGSIAELYETLLEKGDDVEAALAGVYMNRGVTFADTQQLGNALADYDRAVEIREKLDTQGRLADRNDLAAAYMNRGTAFQDKQDTDRAFADYGRAIEIREKLDAEGRLQDRNNLASVYMNRGNSHLYQQKTERAIADYDRAIEIREKLVAEGRLGVRNDLASTYMDRGNAFSDRLDPENAVADYDRAIEIREKLDAEGALLDGNDLAGVYMNRGNASFRQRKLESAIAYYDRAAAIQEKLDAEGRLLDRNDLASVYMNRGTVLLHRQDVATAIAEYGRAIEIREKLDAEGRLLNRNALASVYANRGDALRDQQDLETAIADYARAIELREQLDAEGRLLDRNDLASAYIGRASSFDNLGQPAGAIADCDRAIRIQETLDAEGRLLDRSDLAGAYMEKGSACLHQGDTDGAIACHNRAVDLLETLDAEGRLPDRNDLARAYLNRGNVFMDKAELEKAIADYDRTIAIEERLYEEDGLLDPNDLASAYMSRGSAFLDQGTPEVALIDYERAVKLREKLDAEGRLLDRSHLATSYLGRGKAFSLLHKSESAIVDYDRALRVLDSMGTKENGNVEQCRKRIMKARGDQHLAMGDFKSAVGIYLKPESTGPTDAARDEVERAFKIFLERVSDSIFGRRAWTYLSDEEKRLVGANGGASAETPATGSSLEMKRFALSFYDRATLLELRRIENGVGGDQIWVLDNEGVYTRLDGSSAPIHDADEACPIKLTRENVLDYLRFFCFFVNGEEGPFFIVDSVDHPVFDQERLDAQQRETVQKESRQPEILDLSEDGLFTVSAVVMYGNALFRAVFKIGPRGGIEMVDDEPLAGDLPARKLKTDY